jgi:hypothetical protein
MRAIAMREKQRRQTAMRRCRFLVQSGDAGRLQAAISDDVTHAHQHRSSDRSRQCGRYRREPALSISWLPWRQSRTGSDAIGRVHHARIWAVAQVWSGRRLALHGGCF